MLLNFVWFDMCLKSEIRNMTSLFDPLVLRKRAEGKAEPYARKNNINQWRC